MSLSTRIQIVPIEQIPPEAPSPRSGFMVLVVDDEKIIADTLSIILSRKGFLVQTAYDSRQALEIAARTTPSLLLSDVMMGPGMDGTELAIEMTRFHPACKVILFSGHAATQDLLEKARSRGYTFPVLTKPLHPQELLARIDECIACTPAA